jgi:hypothetical protein
MTLQRRIVITAALALAIVGVSSAEPAQPDAGVAQPQAAETHAHGHAQHGHAGAVAGLEFDAGKRWPTDAALREGMSSIRQAFDADHPRIHRGEQTDAQYDGLADTVGQQVDRIIANCKLPPAADAQLHLVVADLLQGAALMHDPGDGTRHDGAALVHGALIAYGKYFDDPDWKPESMHAH